MFTGTGKKSQLRFCQNGGKIIIASKFSIWQLKNSNTLNLKAFLGQNELKKLRIFKNLDRIDIWVALIIRAKNLQNLYFGKMSDQTF